MASQQRLAPPRPRYHMVPHGTIWYHMVPYGTIWFVGKSFLFPGWGCLLAQRMCSLLKHTQHKHRHACRASSHIMPRHAGGLPILPMTHNHAHISCRHTSSPYSCARRPVVHRITFPRAAQKDDDSTRAAGIAFVRCGVCAWGGRRPPGHLPG